LNKSPAPLIDSSGRARLLCAVPLALGRLRPFLLQSAWRPLPLANVSCALDRSSAGLHGTLNGLSLKILTGFFLQAV
jgi:hypothetical protein